MSNSEIVNWLHEKLSEAEAALSARKQMASTWQGGTDSTWKAAGCRMNKSQRQREADMQNRIAEKCERDVQMFKAVIIAYTANVRIDVKRLNLDDVLTTLNREPVHFYKGKKCLEAPKQ